MDDTHARWTAQLGDAYTEQQVARLLNVTTDEVDQHPGLLRLDQADGQAVYPSCQFDADGQLLPGLSEVVRTLTPAVATMWTIASWITTPHVQLDGRRPVDACASGEHDAVVELARQWAADLTR